MIAIFFLFDMTNVHRLDVGRRKCIPVLYKLLRHWFYLVIYGNVFQLLHDYQHIHNSFLQLCILTVNMFKEDESHQSYLYFLPNSWTQVVIIYVVTLKMLRPLVPTLFLLEVLENFPCQNWIGLVKYILFDATQSSEIKAIFL